MANETAIWTRSPFIMKLVGTAGQTASCQIRLWNDPGSVPSAATYTLTKDIVGTDAYFDITPYCREYIAHSSFTDLASGQAAAGVGEYCYANVKLILDGSLQDNNNYICFDGYGYHEDGAFGLFGVLNTAHGEEVFLDEGEYYVNENVNSGSVYILDNTIASWTATYTGLTTGGTTNVNITNTIGHIPLLLDTYKSEGNTLEIKKDAVLQKTFTATVECEDKYTPVEVDFVNRYGVWQRIMFFKVSKDNIEVRNDEYKMYPSSIQYTTTDNIVQAFNTNGTQKVTCNTGWVREGYSEVIKQLLLSEKVLLDGVAVKVDTKSVELFKHINEKNINYQIDFMHSHDLINYVI